MKKIEDYVISIPDFPEPGIIFRDITGILRDADGLKLSIDKIQEMLEGRFLCPYWHGQLGCKNNSRLWWSQ